MKSVEFPQQTAVIAKDQPPYAPLAAHIKEGVVTSCWEPDVEDIKRIALYGKIYVSQCTFGRQLQPLIVQTEFNPPLLPSPPKPSPQEQPTPELKSGQVPFRSSVKRIAHCKGLSQQILFAMDVESHPGKAICHFVRLETIEFADNADFNGSSINTLHPDSDPRLEFLADCFTGPQHQASVQMYRTIRLLMGNLVQAEQTVKFPPYLQRSVALALQAAEKVCETYG